MAPEQLELTTAARKYQPNPRGNQQCRALFWMMSGHRLNITNAPQVCGIGALSQRMGDLRRDGWDIKSEIITTPGGARISEYYMERG